MNRQDMWEVLFKAIKEDQDVACRLQHSFDDEGQWSLPMSLLDELGVVMNTSARKIKLIFGHDKENIIIELDKGAKK